MHIPDGYIGLPTSIAAATTAVGGLGASLRTARHSLGERAIPLAGLAAAFVFVLQMLNFPVAAGTTGHLLGGALAAILLGPRVGVMVMTVVVVVQALVFADGGVTAIGLNVVNMALVAVLVGWFVFRAVVAVLPSSGFWIVMATMVASWVSVVAASAAFVGEYAMGGGGQVPTSTVFGAMVGIHALIGIGEGLIAGLVLSAVLATRPDLVYGAKKAGVRGVQRVRLGRAAIGSFVATGLAAAVLIVVVIAPRAATEPDGLERVTIDHGIAGSATDSLAEVSPLADYGVAGIEDEDVGTILAGLIGLGMTFVGGGLILRVASRRGDREAASV